MCACPALLLPPSFGCSRKIFGFLRHPTSDVSTNIRRPWSRTLLQLGALPSAWVETTCVLLLAAVAEPQGCQHGLVPGARSTLPARGWPYGPRQPAASGAGAPWGTRCSGLAERRRPWCRVASARGDDGNRHPTTSRPSCASNRDPRAENLSQGFGEGQSPRGRSGQPSSVYCSGTFALAQAGVRTATSFKIWPQTFITQC